MKASVKLGSRCQAVPINQIVPDARRVAAPRKLQQNRLAVHFAGTCCALEIRLWRGHWRHKAGGHLYGRFWRFTTPTTWRTQGHSS
jgi:hypothetical protein